MSCLDETVTFDMEISTREFMDRIIEESDHDELIEIIKFIEEEVADVDFTEELYNHFKNQYEKDSDEVPIIEREDLDVDTTLAIIKGIIVATHKNQAVINGILDYIQELSDNN